MTMSMPASLITYTPIPGNPAPQAPPPAEYPSLSPEGLLIFCQSRLRDMDNKIQAKMADQQKTVALQDTLSLIQSAIKTGDGLGGVDGEAFQNQTVINDINVKIDQAIKDANAAGKPEIAQTLTNVRKILNAGPPGTTGDDYVTKEEVKDMTSMLDNSLSTCRSGAEVSMIELQSLVSKRATQLQLTTGMMNSIDEAPKAIAGNIGR